MSDNNLAGAIEDAFASSMSEAAPASTPDPTSSASEPRSAAPDVSSLPSADSIAKQQEQTPEPVAAEPTPAPEVDDDGEILSVSAEDLAAIKSDPRLALLYKGMVRSYTQKTMSAAEERRLIDHLKNPDTRIATIRAIAAAQGLQINDTPPPPPTPERKAVDAVTERLSQVFDPAVVDILRPAFEELVRTTLEKEVAPLKATAQGLQMESQAQKAEAEVVSFRSRHGNEVTPEIEKKMFELAQELPPGQGVSPGKYMDHLFTIVKAQEQKTKVVKELTTRMTNAKADAEPRGTVQAARISPIGGGEDRRRMSIDDAFNAAWEAAQNETR